MAHIRAAIQIGAFGGLLQLVGRDHRIHLNSSFA
jgi:hypothetical protein